MDEISGAKGIRVVVSQFFSTSFGNIKSVVGKLSKAASKLFKGLNRPLYARNAKIDDKMADKSSANTGTKPVSGSNTKNVREKRQNAAFKAYGKIRKIINILQRNR